MTKSPCFLCLWQLVRLASDVVAGAFFEWAGPGSSRSVALVLEPRGRLERRVRFRLLAAPPEEFFRPPEVGEADGLWADQLMAAVNRDAAAQLAPLANVADALLLGRVWLRQRQLDDAFGFFVLTQFVLHLVDTKKILPTMSHFQVPPFFPVDFASCPPITGDRVLENPFIEILT